MRMLVTASPSTLRLPDNFGWLPLHYACSNEASLRVLALLVEAYPESRARVDKRGRTPLHFCLGQADRPAGEDEVSLLSGAGDAMQGGGASDMADENGMLVSACSLLYIVPESWGVGAGFAKVIIAVI